MIENIDFIKENYGEQINTLNEFIKNVYPGLPNKDNSLIKFGGGIALAIYYFQHRLSFDIDLSNDIFTSTVYVENIGDIIAKKIV